MVDVTLKFAGRLGNNMFQVAAAAAHAKRWGLTWAIPKCYPTDIYRFNLPVTDDGPERTCPWIEPGFHYYPIPRTDSRTPHCLHGFYQSYRYFEDCADYIRDLFKLASVDRQRLVSLHVRRGDFVSHGDCFRVLPLYYYQNAVQVFTARGFKDFLVFSDDPLWCARHLPSVMPNVNFQFSTVNGAYDALSRMAACAGHIIANSTFSWWAAWLNHGATVVCPHRRDWFGPQYAKANMDDLYPPWWLQLQAGDLRV